MTGACGCGERGCKADMRTPVLSGAQVTRERIRQIEAKAIMKLRQPDRSAVLKDYINHSTGVKVAWRAHSSKARS